MWTAPALWGFCCYKSTDTRMCSLTLHFALRPRKCPKRVPTTGMHWPVVDFVGRREAFFGPVKQTVEKDKAGKSGPAPHDGLEGEACIVDQLGREQDRHSFEHVHTYLSRCDLPWLQGRWQQRRRRSQSSETWWLSSERQTCWEAAGREKKTGTS